MREFSPYIGNSCQMKLSEKIKALREAEGLSQSKFCEIIELPLSTLKNMKEETLNPVAQLC